MLLAHFEKSYGMQLEAFTQDTLKNNPLQEFDDFRKLTVSTWNFLFTLHIKGSQYFRFDTQIFEM